MRTVLAFDFDNSIGKAFIGQFDGKKIRYEELKRIKVEPIIDNKRLYWDYFSLIEEIKRNIAECDNIDSLAFDTWGRDYGLLVERDYPMRQPFV